MVIGTSMLHKVEVVQATKGTHKWVDQYWYHSAIFCNLVCPKPFGAFQNQYTIQETMVLT
jgi:hypothetical protein